MEKTSGADPIKGRDRAYTQQAWFWDFALGPRFANPVSLTGRRLRRSRGIEILDHTNVHASMIYMQALHRGVRGVLGIVNLLNAHPRGYAA